MCTRNGIAFRLVNPTIVPHLRCVERVRSKTDRSDAQLLHQYGNREDIGEDLPRDRCARETASILSIYGLLQRNRIALQGGLDAYRREPLLPKALCSLLEEEIQRYKVFERDIIKLAGKTAEEGGRKEKLEILKSIPGAGPVVALHLLVFFSTFHDADRKKITALAGLDPVQRESGISVRGKSRISKQGNAQLRKMLFQATLSAARYNPPIREHYRQLRAAGKPDKVARIAAARKLLLLALSIYRSERPFISDPPVSGNDP